MYNLGKIACAHSESSDQPAHSRSLKKSSQDNLWVAEDSTRL